MFHYFGKKINVVFIPKPGKADYTSPKSFRPISLSCALLKGLERLIDKYLRENISLDSSQHAYQACKSTESALHDVTNEVESAFAEKEFVICTLTDIGGAFDNMNFEAIKTELAERGINIHVRTWIAYMLENRKVTYRTNDGEVTIVAKKGTPQGGVLSPMLWIIVMDKLLTRLRAAGIKAVGFADDLAIMCRGKFPSTLTDITNRALKIVDKWCKETGLSANPDKTEYIIFTKNRKLDNFGDIKLTGTKLVRKENVKYLGLWFNSKLNWTNHIEQKIDKCTKIFWCCKKAIGKNWGLTPKNILWIYTAIVRPLLAYGSFIWWGGAITAINKKKLNTLQRLACLSITGAMRSTPQDTMDALLMLPKLDDFISVEAQNASIRVLKLWSQKINSVKDGHSSILLKVLEQNKIFAAKFDHINVKFNFNKTFKTIVPSREDWNTYERFANDNFDLWFTDGSVNRVSSGYGVYNANNDTRIYGNTGKYATIAQTEIVAIVSCCLKIQEDATNTKPIRIFTDSLSAIKALESPKITSLLVWECIGIIGSITTSRNLELIWIPSHSNLHGNTVADELAKRGAKIQTSIAEPAIPLDTKLVKKSTSKLLHDTIRSNWLLATGCSISKQFLAAPNEKITTSLLCLTKGQLSKVIKTISGHCKLNHHLNKMGIRDDPDCNYCGRSIETSTHILCQCEALSAYRYITFGTHFVTTSDVLCHSPNKIVEFFNRISRQI